MSLLKKFQEFIRRQSLFQQDDRLLLAVSGGLDSVVLSHLCRETGYDFAIAHCHFGLRGEESNRDEAFVRHCAATMGVDCFVKHFDTKLYAQEHKLSIQVAARQLRYDWFRFLSKQENFTWLLTAHHRDDNVETVLMNLVKGTGISGLTGIQAKRDGLIRPLLFAHRKEILQYATEQRLNWVEDSSNDETKYTRNAFRHDIIPALEKIYPNASQNIAATVDYLTDARILYEEALEKHKKALITVKGAERHIPVLKLQKTPAFRTVLYEIIRPYDFGSNAVEEVVKLLRSENGKWMASHTHRIIRHGAWLIIAPHQIITQSLMVIDAPDTTVLFQKGRISISTCDKETVAFLDNDTVFVDAAEVAFPLVLRPWKAGDYFYPLGMKKKKKLSRYFIDAKLSKTKKESVWVLESEKRIIWVVGHRIDERFRIKSGTSKVLKLMLSNP
jgi:tRNA(Ile)-lysidine synthase